MQEHDHALEKNDLYGLVCAVIAISNFWLPPLGELYLLDRKTGAQAAVEAAGYEWRSIIDLDDLGLQAQ